ncbi:hypothetical protein [Leifsonia sp. 71-9]|nr:hypothetical protein [Leifsonia sp. 71-9]
MSGQKDFDQTQDMQDWERKWIEQHRGIVRPRSEFDFDLADLDVRPEGEQ